MPQPPHDDVLRGSQQPHRLLAAASHQPAGRWSPEPETTPERQMTSVADHVTSATPPSTAYVAHRPAVEIVVPVHDEERDLARGVRRLHGYLTDDFPFSWRVTIADNASTDRTWQVATSLAAELPSVRAVHLDAKGRGRALAAVWSTSDATVVAYMDVDLSTDLAALLPLVAPLLSGHSDVAIGSRLSGTARVVRGPKRELISRAYTAILHATLATRFSDAQCGFKAVRADRARMLLPLVEDTGWFFDTELLVLAERAGLRIHEVPVDWVDDPESRVDLVATAVADLRGITRLARGLATGTIPIGTLRSELARHGRVGRQLASTTVQVLRFAAVGAVSTVAYLVLYALLRTAMPALAANALALLATAVANTAANRRYTFEVRDNTRLLRHHVQGLVVFGAALALTSGSLALLHLASREPSRSLEMGVLVCANLVATALRFVALRGWVFRTPARPSAPLPIRTTTAGSVR
jgi:putative flippase GtrA